MISSALFSHSLTITNQLSVARSCSLLGRNTGIDAFVKRATGRVHREQVFIFAKHPHLVLGQARNLVNVADGAVGAVRGQFASRMREHARKLFVVALCVRVVEEKEERMKFSTNTRDVLAGLSMSVVVE